MNTHQTRTLTSLVGGAFLLALIAGPCLTAVQAAPLEGRPDAHCPLPDKFPRFSAEHLPPHLQQLGLSEEQRKQIGALFEAQGKSMKDKLEAGEKAHKALRDLAQSDDYSDDKANALIQGNAATMAAVALAHARLDHEVYRLLTPEQRIKLKENQGKFGEFPRRHGGHGPRPE
jgi:Spy/CpxP family protein refolding chaperone